MQPKPCSAVSFNATQIKWIAMVIMTIDHLAAFHAFPMSGALYSDMRLIGRIAAPLFLFMNVEALHHSHSRGKLLLRLYLGGAVVGCINALLAAKLPEQTAQLPGNMFPTFFYVGLFVDAIETLRARPGPRRRLLAPAALLLPFACNALDVWLCWHGQLSLRPWVQAFLPSPNAVDYSLLFVLLGVVWYFVNDRKRNCLIFLALSLLSRAVPGECFFGAPFTEIPFLHPDCFTVWHLFTPSQWCMVFALPLMLCYNGERGKGSRTLFYLYYPIHQYLLFFLGLLTAGAIRIL